MQGKKEAPDPALQARLRKMVIGASVHTVSRDTGLTRHQILQYLASVPMNAAVIRGIERTLTEGDDGLRR